MGPWGVWGSGSVLYIWDAGRTSGGVRGVVLGPAFLVGLLVLGGYTNVLDAVGTIETKKGVGGAGEVASLVVPLIFFPLFP